jgi:AraC-like DNA-binding protein/mannose-6-phosphate isomerase-like protein (cupin superfamily)
MEIKPFFQKEEFTTSFPFLIRDSTMPTFSFPPHWHNRFEILYIQKGKLYLIYDRKGFSVRERDIVIVDMAIIHGYLNPSTGTAVRLYQFDSHIFGDNKIHLRDGVAWDLSFAAKPVITIDNGRKVHSRSEDCLLEMHHEYCEKKPGFQLAVMSKLYEFTTIFLRETPELWNYNEIGVNDRRLDKMRAYIKRNYDNPDLTLTWAAKEAALSKYHFARLFREKTGETFHAWLSHLRVQHAKESLLSTGKSITDIAYQCGFSSLPTFNRLFRTYSGVSPSRYREGKVKIS